MSEYLPTADQDWYKQRLAGVMLVAVAAFAILGFRLFHLQVLHGDELRELSERNSIRLQSIDPPRGLIFDRNGRLLVDNRPAFDVSIIPKDAKPLEETIRKLSRLLGVPADGLMTKIKTRRRQSAYQPIPLKQDIGRNVLAAIEARRYDLPGVFIDVKPRRQYIYRQSAAHLIGYLGEINADELSCGLYDDCRAGDYIGKFGIEKAYESSLRGGRGGRQVEVSAKGQVVRVMKTVGAKPGQNIFLTIDQQLQLKAEELLAAQAGAAIAMDPTTGQLLAMASSPSFDQNAFVSGMTHDQWNVLISNPQRPMSNKAVQGEYPPASTYKIVTAIAGLEEELIDETTTFFCPGFLKFGNRVYRCWKKGGHGHMDVVRAIAESCDVFFYQVGQKLGVDRIAWYARACGLGSSTGSKMDHEAKGLIPTAEWKLKRTGIPWQAGETLSVAIGQGYNLVTPIQMLTLVAAVANQGAQYQPFVLERVETAQEEVIKTSQPKEVSRLPVSPDTLELVRRGLWEVVNTPGGTAYGSRLKDVDMSGKTGTAQIVGRKDDEPEAEDEEIEEQFKDHAWFVAYAPSEAPRIAVAVIVEHGEHGSSTAAPIAREMIRSYLKNLPAEARQLATVSEDVE
ncbi:Peptidoglycan D,D-transpeptidase MrdA (EC [Olavius algarvensis associated proteobacterium Delta 3]|nr:Peptidoglycan D,D-transpeptidase MrdA (EC [Olavius algarvensis associated proteobacterium Delta 3]CAB5158007.1 Peptidoglycan D,D-transpeptidase MrdA (EC [Olavius algarvensis associated proteobacterium Delta 3]